MLVGELRTLLSDIMSPLTVLASEVMGPSILNTVTGEKLESWACSANGLNISSTTYYYLIYFFNSLESLVSELQAAQILKHKELHPEDKPTEEESEKEQRVEVGLTEFSEEYEEDADKDRREAEMQAEWILLLHALNMDSSCQFTDVLSEVSLIK